MQMHGTTPGTHRSQAQLLYVVTHMAVFIQSF